MSYKCIEALAQGLKNHPIAVLQAPFLSIIINLPESFFSSLGNFQRSS